MNSMIYQYTLLLKMYRGTEADFGASRDFELSEGRRSLSSARSLYRIFSFKLVLDDINAIHIVISLVGGISHLLYREI